MEERRGRPKKPEKDKRVKIQPWVHPNTKYWLKREADQKNTTIGHILDEWIKNRATQNTRSAENLTKKTVTILDNQDPDKLDI